MEEIIDINVWRAKSAYADYIRALNAPLNKHYRFRVWLKEKKVEETRARQILTKDQMLKILNDTCQEQEVA